MTLLEVFIFAITQGITEFLPISSSGHLGVLNHFFETAQSSHLQFELAVHFGTVFAVVIYFWQDLYKMLRSKLKKSERNLPESKMFDRLVLSSIPLIIIGAIIQLKFDNSWRDSLVLIGWTTIIFGFLLQFMDRMGLKIRKIQHLRNTDILILGFAQCLAVIPGVSRSGITITFGRGLGLERSEAAKFSMLMSIPVLLVSGGYTMLDTFLSDNATLTNEMMLAMVISFATALIVIRSLMLWVRNSSFFPFVVYRTIIGIILLLIGYNIL